MTPGPTDPRQLRPNVNPTWNDILVSYALLVGALVLAWTLSDPIPNGLVLAGTASLAFVARHAYRIGRCVRECKAYAFDVGGAVRVTIAQPPTEPANCC